MGRVKRESSRGGPENGCYQGEGAVERMGVISITRDTGEGKILAVIGGGRQVRGFRVFGGWWQCWHASSAMS